MNLKKRDTIRESAEIKMLEVKNNKLAWAILVFVLLDLSILAINYRITHQIDRDAAAINLAGRQRMLSQRITKSVLALKIQGPSEDTSLTREELMSSVRMFNQTLYAFKRGGVVAGGEGGNVTLDWVDPHLSGQYIDSAIRIWVPIYEILSPYLTPGINIPPEAIDRAQKQIIRDNLLLLDLMNHFTSEMERVSQDRANSLWHIQIMVFLVALLNFMLIIHKFRFLARQSTKATQYYSQLAMCDPLTGLFNRRQFKNNLEIEMEAVNNGQHDNGALVMIDLDRFKPINDKYGHEVGDDVLREIAARIAATARSNDTVARLGGDEFALVCPGLHKKKADALCQRLLESINQPIATDKGQLCIGASIGVAFYSTQNNNGDDLLRTADKAMYEAKNTGRNRYACCD